MSQGTPVVAAGYDACQINWPGHWRETMPTPENLVWDAEEARERERLPQ